MATTPSPSALGIVRLSGAQALAAASAFLFPDGPLEPRRATLREARFKGEKLDDVVAVYYPAESSPTGEPLVELTAHGSPLILKRLLEAALASGAREAAPGEFTRRAFLNGKLDLAQAEAVAGLISARSEASRRAALRRLDGELSRAVRAAREPLFDLRVRLEASIDHPEEEIPLVPAAEAAAGLARCAEGLRALRATFAGGRGLREGARVCLAGRPNAGKSSLLNAMLGFERAIVSPLPGTTRDTVEETLELEGGAVVLVDTAGAREEAADPAEREGLARALRAVAASDLAVFVVDGSRPLTDEDRRAHERLLAHRAGRPVLWALNKSDLGVAARLEGAVEVSAKDRAGVDALLERISAGLRADAAASAGEDSAADRRSAALVDAALGELDAAADRLAAFPDDWEDRTAFHLREACARLGEILGEGSPDEALDAVFSRFCVGK